MVLVESPQFQGIKRGPRRQGRWRVWRPHGRVWVAYIHLKLNDNQNFQELFSLISPRMKDWPPEILVAITLGLVTRLAPKPGKLKSGIRREVAEKVWESVRSE
jgi:hypothetical protein